MILIEFCAKSVKRRMITKHRLSGNTSFGDVVSGMTSGCDSNSDEATHEEDMLQDDRCSNQHSNDVASTTPRRRGSSVKKPIPGPLASDDSCNAVDHMLGANEKPPKECTDSDKDSDLSFNGKIKTLTSAARADDVKISSMIGTDGNDLVSRQEKLIASFELLTKENNSLIHYNNEKSPDMFADDDDDDVDDGDGEDNDDDGGDNDLVVGGKKAEGCLLRSYHVRTSGTGKDLDCGNGSEVDRVDRILLKRIQTSLAGIPPPPALTHSDIDIGSMLTIYRSNIDRWLVSNCAEKIEPAGENRLENGEQPSAVECLMKPSQPLNEMIATKWPDITRQRAHGLHYNRSTATETFEMLTLKYIERYISAETSSSFSMTVLQSSAKKRNQRLKKSENRRKNKIKTPKRRTPGGNRRSPRRRTPGSSAKKFTLHRGTPNGKSSQKVHIPATRESSKRALFLSPQNGGGAAASTSSSAVGSNSKQLTERSMFSEARVMKSKRSLFSAPHATETVQTTTAISKTNDVKSNKRRRSSIADDEAGEAGPSGERMEKIRRTDSSTLTEEDLTPRSLKFSRSKSFCVGLESTATLPSSSVSECAPVRVGGKLLFRANSEISSEDGPRPVSTLTENHKKKLLWAVSQALQSRQITAKHELFKQHASNLVRVVKRLFLEFNDQTTSSTSEKLLKLANKHVYEVIQGKSVDEIYLREKVRIMNARNMTKLQGYIAPEEYELRKLKRTASIASFDGSSPFDCTLSASQSFLSQSSLLSQGSSISGVGLSQQLSQSSGFGMTRTGLIKPASSTGSMHTVGLGGSLGTTVLRENVDSELRQRSIKKQLSFSGKDHQKNVSPFKMEKSLSLVGGSLNTNKLLVGGALSSSIMKAKRQISFE
uniref:Uncharacterized protein n=1 Tax=Anopheles farauti TaxID=69004 RepID=A0A182QZ38_9DIPT